MEKPIKESYLVTLEVTVWLEGGDLIVIRGELDSPLKKTDKDDADADDEGEDEDESNTNKKSKKEKKSREKVANSEKNSSKIKKEAD
ncbi:hypothetical protein Avbf_06532 [Armadillidium vulgare]|nr:hypothetical protein Avbf_06532 [Armadillidium vulgare]